MNEVIINENIKIIKDKTIYKINFKYSCYSLIKSILNTHIIQGGSTDESYKTIKFKAESVKTLKQYENEKRKINGRKGLLVSDTARMIRSLSSQLDYLIRSESCTFLGYNTDEIIVINNEKFAFLDSELIANINPDEDENVMISSPFFSDSFFASPELLKLKIIPSFIHYKTAYFSLGLLIIYAVLGDNDFYLDFLEHNNIKNILSTLNNHPIKETRIYWLITRCLVEEPINRSIILI